MIDGAPYTDEFSILVTMPDISNFTTIAIISDMITVKRFSNSKKFESYLSSAPKVDSSDEKTSIKNTIKMGHRLSISMIAQSLNHFIDSKYKISYWNNKLGMHKKKGKVRMGVCRKMLTVFIKCSNMNYWTNIALNLSTFIPLHHNFSHRSPIIYNSSLQK